MTGKDLIIYILQNNLEDEPVFKDGKFVGFITDLEAAAKLNVGVATIWALISRGQLTGIMVGGTIHVPADCKLEKTE